MSVGSYLVKGSVILACFAGIGWTTSMVGSVSRSNENTEALIKSLKSQYNDKKNVKPTTKTVTTNYQKAVNLANKYLDLSNKLHDESDVNKRDDYLKQMRKLSNSPSDINGPLVAYDVKDWRGETSYGGQNAKGQIMMAYRFYNNENKLMAVYTFNYDVASDKLSSFVQFVTNDGKQSVQSALRG